MGCCDVRRSVSVLVVTGCTPVPKTGTKCVKYSWGSVYYVTRGYLPLLEAVWRDWGMTCVELVGLCDVGDISVREADTRAVCGTPMLIQSVIKVVYGQGGVSIPVWSELWGSVEFSGTFRFDCTTGS